MTGRFGISIDRAGWARLADHLAVVVAVTLPWSVSATSIAIVLWVLALIPSLDMQAVRREVSTWSGGLPVALFAFGALGMTWADVAFAERADGLVPFVRLLSIPLLFIQFRRSDHGVRVLTWFLASTAVLLAVSFASAFTPGNLWGLAKSYGVPVKDYLAQAAEFTLSAFGAFYLGLQAWRGRRGPAAVQWIVLGLAFLANIFLIVTSRTALVTIPVLVVAFIATQFVGKVRVAFAAIAVLAVFAALAISPVARERLQSLATEVEERHWHVTSAGERLEFWTDGLAIVRAAPLLGHGTGTIRDQYQRIAAGKPNSAAATADNPHNQTLTMAMQLGVAGALLLYAMWFSHLLLFCRPGLPAFVGLIVVLQNVVGSLFNSHLFDFTHGWIYVFGVGIAGGVVRAHMDRAAR
jgi:O-antigen ligase